jgi:PAS domain S-box-containing protein
MESSGMDQSGKFDALRNQAKELLRRRQTDTSAFPGDILELIEELQIHQVELEIQNEELKRSQQELSELHQRYADLYEFAPCGYVSLSPKGIISGINLTGVKLLGAERRNLTFRRLSSFVCREHQGELHAALRRAAETGERESLELELHRETGDSLWARADISPDADQSGAISAWRLTLIDVSERKRAEQELTRAKERAESANRAKSDFLAHMSHEIRTPMNSILGMLRLMDYNPLEATQRERLHVARDSAESLLYLLNDILDLSKIESGKFELHAREFSLHAFLNNVVREMETTAHEKGLRLTLAIAGNVPVKVWGDSYRLRQVLFNLLSNAVKYTEQGRISLEVEPLGWSCSNPDHPEMELLFRVRDTGPGIREDRQKTIFDTYEQDRAQHRKGGDGVGLGLAICKRIVDQMGGSIWLESAPGKGSTFTCLVPFRTQGDLPAQDLSEDRERRQRKELPHLSLLLVEDERMNQIFTLDLLSSNGHEVEVAENGRQALEKLREKTFDLVLMDMKMPVMDGLEAARRIRTSDPMELNPDIPIIGLSAHAVNDQEKERLKSAGLDEYVTKPVDFNALFDAMQRVLTSKGG